MGCSREKRLSPEDKLEISETSGFSLLGGTLLAFLLRGYLMNTFTHFQEARNATLHCFRAEG